MTKTKRQLRAEAVERLNGLGKYVQASSIQWGLFGSGKDNMPPDKLRDELVSLLTDEELPEGDAVSIMRKAAKCTSVNTSVGDVLRYNVPGNGGSAWQTEEDACEALADMVERDYVPRKQWEEAVRAMKAAQDRMEQARDESDEWKAKAEQLANDGLPAENDVKPQDVDANDANVDTREKLEADVRRWHDGNYFSGYVDEDEFADVVIVWLDRQAAITERHILTHPDERDEQIAELEDANAALKRELKLARGELSVTLNNWEQAKGKIRREKDELANCRKKLDELAANPEGPLHAKIERLEERCAKLKAERDSLKAKLEAVREAAR